VTAKRRAPRKKTRATPAARVRHLVALDAQNVMHRLDARADEMVGLFSRLRTRTPMLEATESWLPTASFGELVQLEPHEQAAVSDFHEALGALRWYFEYTEDMPGTVQATAAAHLTRLREAHARLRAVIGAPREQGAPAVDASVVVHDPPPPAALPHPKKR